MNHTTRRFVGIGAGLVLVAGVTTTGVMALDSAGGHRITAYFDRATGLYAGSDLRILGVKVGRVDSVRPEGREVRVVLALDKGVKVPADARALIVAPSIVADRYVQLSPAYAGGPQLKDRATLAADRNATPSRSTSCTRASPSWPPHSGRRAPTRRVRWTICSRPARPT